MSTLIDLTMPIAPGMPFNPDHFPHEISTYATVPTHGWEARRLSLDSHLGTHVDAPAHFVEGGETIDETPLDVLVGAARVIRLTHLGPRDAITPDLLSLSESVASSSAPAGCGACCGREGALSTVSLLGARHRGGAC